MQQFGIQRLVQTLRNELVSYLENNPFDNKGFPLDLYIGMPFSEYLKAMASDRTYGDELTLRAAVEVFNIEIVIISSLGRAGQITISSRNFEPQGRIILGHMAEGMGEHYVVLNPFDINDSMDEDYIDFQIDDQSLFSGRFYFLLITF